MDGSGRGDAKGGGSLREDLKGSAGTLARPIPKLRESTSLDGSPRSAEERRAEYGAFPFEVVWGMWSMSRGKEGLKRFEGEAWERSAEMRFAGSGAEGESGISSTSRWADGDMGVGFLRVLRADERHEDGHAARKGHVPAAAEEGAPGMAGLNLEGACGTVGERRGR